MKDFGKKLKRLMFEANVNQEDLAKHLNLDQSYISKLQKERRKPSLKKLEEIAKYFKVPINFFLENSNNTQTGNNNIIGNRSNISQVKETAIRSKLLALSNMYYEENKIVKVIKSKNTKTPINLLNYKNSSLIPANANMLIDDFENITAKEFENRFKEKISAKKVLLALYSGKDSKKTKGFVDDKE